MCRNVEICADSTLWMQTHKVSCILGPDFFNCCGHFSLRWHVKRRVPHLLTPPVGLELKRIFLGNNTTTRLQMRIWCIPLFPSRPSSRRTFDGLMDFLVEWGSATITARASPLWNTILSLYWIKMMMSAQYRSRISTYTLGAPCLFISRYPTPTIHRNRRQRSWMIYSQQIFSFQQ